MADDHPLGERRRSHEEDYFRKKDRELIERMRQQAAAEQARKDLGAEAGVTDPKLLDELAQLGFTKDTVRLLPLVPVIEVAWAEGGITPAERKMLTELARARGIEAGSAADQKLSDWLERQPGEDVFRRATRLIAALIDANAPSTLSASDLIKYAEQIADASGGIFGLRRISADERSTLARIAEELKTRGS
jgi:hypothetical protein